MHERSISYIKIIKNYLTFNAEVNILNPLFVFYIESEIMQSMNYREIIIRSFVKRDVRRVTI